MHFLSTSVYCLIRPAPIVLINVNCFQLATVYVSITLPRVFLTCRLDSPALNQAHPVSPGIKPKRTQSCLLDCTGWFTAVFQALSPQLPIPTVLCYSHHVFVRLCLFLPVPVPSPSVYLRPVWNWPSLASRLHLCTSAQWFPDSTHARPRTRLGLSLRSLITGIQTLDWLITLWFLPYFLLDNDEQASFYLDKSLVANNNQSIKS